jgi:DNA phosphorothioation-associated putative methyltransferase
MKYEYSKEKTKLTAIKRNKLSAPVKYYLETFSPSNGRILDYGCGKGDDVNYLIKEGFEAHGYDPLFSEFQKFPTYVYRFDIVFMTYVICTIPDSLERLDATTGAWGFVRNNGELIITVRTYNEINNEASKANWMGHPQIGYITSRGTFQKGFLKEDLLEYIKRIPNIKEYQIVEKDFLMCILKKGGAI